MFAEKVKNGELYFKAVNESLVAKLHNKKCPNKSVNHTRTFPYVL